MYSIFISEVETDLYQLLNVDRNYNSELIIWKIDLKFSTSKSGKSIKIEEKPQLVEALSESIHFPKSVITFFEASNKYLVLWSFSLQVYHSQAAVFDFEKVGLVRIPTKTREHIILKTLVEDCTLRERNMI